MATKPASKISVKPNIVNPTLADSGDSVLRQNGHTWLKYEEKRIFSLETCCHGNQTGLQDRRYTTNCESHVANVYYNLLWQNGHICRRYT